MRDGHLLGGLLANAKSWINLNKQNDEAHERPDTQLLRKLFSTSGNPCKLFMMLEVGIIPVRFVIMQKQLLFLQYILKQSMDTMIRKVYETMKGDSRKGDFVNLTETDKKELEIVFSDEEIISMSKWKFRKEVKLKVKFAAFSHLVKENSTKDKTKHIRFEDLTISEYLKQNKISSLSNFIFSIRSKTLDIKELQPWNYDDLLCVKCNLYSETLEHFATCVEYGNPFETDWKDIFGKDGKKQTQVGLFLEKRYTTRNKLIAQLEDGQASSSGSSAPVTL